MASTTPAPSWPRTTGSGVPNWPPSMCASEWHTPVAASRTTTSPAAGSSSVRSSMASGALYARITAARVGIGIVCPFRVSGIQEAAGARSLAEIITMGRGGAKRGHRSAGFDGAARRTEAIQLGSGPAGQLIGYGAADGEPQWAAVPREAQRQPQSPAIWQWSDKRNALEAA